LERVANKIESSKKEKGDEAATCKRGEAQPKKRR